MQCHLSVLQSNHYCKASVITVCDTRLAHHAGAVHEQRRSGLFFFVQRNEHVAQVVRDVAGAMMAQLLERQAGRLGVPVETLFPQWPLLRSWLLPAAGSA